MKNILIIRFSALGDLVVMEHLFRAIRFFYHDANITFLTSSIGKGLYQDSNYFNEFIVYKNFPKTITILKEKKYDIIFNLQCNRLSHLLLIFIKKRILVNKSHTALQKFFKLKPIEKLTYDIIESSGINKSHLDNYFNNKSAYMTKLPTKKSDKYKSLFNKKFYNKKIIAIAPGASIRWQSKKWGKEKFSQLVSLLNNHYGIVLIGSQLEKNDAIFIENNNQGIINMANKTIDLCDLKNLISSVDFYIGNDSGPTHIAAAIGISTLTIFGSTGIKHCPKFIYPNYHICVKPDTSIKCHPCYKTKCPTNLECMGNISVEQIYKETINYFEGSNET